MPSYKLMYFNSRGRAETSRMLFALADQKYEDYRFKDGEWPGELKGNADLFPLGQAPVLIIDGKAMPHSKAIHRHLAREFGFYGANNEEARQIDVVSETVEDIVTKMLPVHFEKDEAKKAELLEAFKTAVKPFLSFLNKYVDNKQFFVGNKATLADVTVYTTMEYVHSIFGEDCMTASWPGLARFYKYITESSELAVYIRNRPVTAH
eukprot:XP_011680286.1 PREDICTED: S-crystallin SL11 isoform X1 [Strongylocentrotus purpuratus]